MRLSREFFTSDVLVVAPGLIGKTLVRKWDNGDITRHIITETEAYRGTDDKACHASKGRTARTEIMFESGGQLYMYLIYGMYWMLNIVTSVKDVPQAVLIRGLGDVYGPGRITRFLELDKSFYGENLLVSDRIWVEDSDLSPEIQTLPRIGIDYAGEPWASRPWRYLMKGGSRFA